ncbi:LOW QUALITY PROTEIN: glycoprotein-N-acetylgalactosamine 3-beta-galactosyltransferase 1-like [Daphnia carinata]|uniref:LOW QUALITY PROTEIN: glycoprotein-N-acetylgalactosamine 3-beta-galactosyltransferase 1-like n=1 Tax=Daphnia carinata TaxID=120202 RepID=UPI00257DC914|nr:LOW QUALITY PROTEIN: glycoprotein-N-acetylgalactosamine 3-beta-galactosyltransferase 1-like [Daphnia carinata]
MKLFLRYSLELLVSFVLLQFFHSTSWFSPDHQSSILSNQLIKFYRSGQSNLSFNTVMEPYDTIRDDLAREMFTKIRVLCWIMTAPRNHWKKARHVKNTWGKRCNKLVFVSTETDNRLPTVKIAAVEGYDNLWGKTREAFRYVWEHYREEADWFLKADDDSFVILENLRYYLSIFNTSDPLYFGHKFKAYIKSGYMQGGSGYIKFSRDLAQVLYNLVMKIGYVLSKEALRRFVEIGLEDPTKCSATEWPEDVEIGRCMENMKCEGMDTRDSYGRNRFLPVSLPIHLTLGIVEDTWLWDMHPSYYPIQGGFDCCSDTAIGFHQLTASDMYLYDYLIYRVNPYGVKDVRLEIQFRPHTPPDVELQEPPYPGPSAADRIWLKELRNRERSELERFGQTESKYYSEENFQDDHK